MSTRALINAGLPFVGSDSRTLGISPSDLKHLVSARHVRRVFHGVYVDSEAPDTRRLRAAALHLVKPQQGVFYGATVCFLHGIDVFPPGDRFNFQPQCMVPHGTSRCRRPLVMSREGYIDPGDLDVIDGLVVTSAVRTVVDLLRILWRPYALAAADAMAHAGLVSPEEVLAYVRPMKHYPGIVQARSLATLIEPRAESPGESAMRLRLIDAGFPVPKPQLEVFDRAGFLLAVLDNAYEEAKVGMDYDGREFHTDPLRKERDTKKRKYLVDNLGWRLGIARREDIFGHDPSYEQQIGGWIGMVPRLPRGW